MVKLDKTYEHAWIIDKFHTEKHSNFQWIMMERVFFEIQETSLVHNWWQGIDVRGSASYKLATKMKEIK